MKLILVLSIALCTLISVSAVCTPDCAGDEHCDATSSTCLCNTTASSPGVNPSPTVNCSGGVLSIYVPKCWLENNGYNSSNVHLQSSACTPAKEVVNNLAELSFHVPLTSASCNNTAYINGTHVIYSNNLYIFAKKSLIQTRQDVVANVSCAYPLTANVTLNVTLHPIVR
ncbi:pancreatic secretory granule membrane major glycoprotein GP2-like [Hyperolius riggenbachi]|uniref:pancreatic secretory granule membrane major glycoprotein GP2-like n=1 Tax=Hyperolius riggenbachi TaxID=752182 RepID=UPI0035A3D517